MAVGDKVYGSDYNAVQLIIKNVLGTGGNYGGGSYGYGRTDLITSGTVAEGNLITETQWNALATDINVAYTHQNNTSFPGFASITGSITWANYLLLNTYAGNCLSNRLTANVGQLVKDSVLATATASFTWSTQVQAYGTVNFTDAAQCRYFFNQGGYINFSGKAYATTPTIAQDLKWHQAMGYFSFNADYSVFSGLGATKPTGANYTLSNGTNANVFANPYNADYIAVRCWLSSATVMDYEIWYVDDHVGITGGPDNVSGGLGAYVNRVRASGAFTGIQPTTQNVVNFA